VGLVIAVGGAWEVVKAKPIVIAPVEHDRLIADRCQLRRHLKCHLRLATKTVGEAALSTSEAIHRATPLPMPSVIMAEPEDFPAAAQAEFFQDLGLLMLIEPTPRTIDLGGRVDRMSTEALIGFGDVFVALLA
jgi:hypothetical protein